MSAAAPVDVLSALDALRKEWRDDSLIVSRLDSADVLDSISTALAELIEAARDVAFVQINRANDMGKAKQLRLRAALARIGGAQ